MCVCLCVYFPSSSVGKESTCNVECRRPGFDPWIGKFPWRMSTMSNSLGRHGRQHTRHPCPSPSPRACSNSCPLSQMPSNYFISCHPLLLLPSVFPRSASFLMSQLFPSGGQSIGASASASVLLMNIQDLFPLGFTGLISLQSRGLSRVFSKATVQKHHFFSVQPSLWSKSHVHTCLLEKP